MPRSEVEPRPITPISNRWIAWEEINGDGLCPTYLFRLVLARLPRGRRVYLHHFVGDDWAVDAHDHPKVFWSIGLWGAYDEDVFDPRTRAWTTRRWRAPWVRRFPAQHAHRVRARHTGGAWTLEFTGPVTQEWGFFAWDEVWTPRRKYLAELGEVRKEC